MSRAGTIAKKELLQARRDRLAALFTLVLPVVFTVFLGIIIGGGGERSLPMAVVDQDMTPASRQLIEELEDSSLITVEAMKSDEIDTAVQNQSIAGALVIPKGFAATVDSSQPVTLQFVRLGTSTGAQSVYETVQKAVSRLDSSLLGTKLAAEKAAAATGRPAAELGSAARSLVEAGLAAPVVTVETVTGSPKADEDVNAVQNAGGFVIASTGSLVQWVLFSLMTVATTVVWERRQGVMRRLASTGAKSEDIIGGKVIAMFVITFLQQTMLVLLGQIAFGVDYFNDVPALIMTMISLSLLASSVGLLISALFRTEPPVIAATVLSAQLLAVLGGAWFPLEVTSESFATVAHFFPTAWIMDCLHGIVLKGWGVPEVLASLGIVWAWIIVLFGLAVWRFRPE